MVLDALIEKLVPDTFRVYSHPGPVYNGMGMGPAFLPNRRENT
jgi:hypothetical protein